MYFCLRWQRLRLFVSEAVADADAAAADQQTIERDRMPTPPAARQQQQQVQHPSPSSSATVASDADGACWATLSQQQEEQRNEWMMRKMWRRSFHLEFIIRVVITGESCSNVDLSRQKSLRFIIILRLSHRPDFSLLPSFSFSSFLCGLIFEAFFCHILFFFSRSVFFTSSLFSSLPLSLVLLLSLAYCLSLFLLLLFIL